MSNFGDCFIKGSLIRKTYVGFCGFLSYDKFCISQVFLFGVSWMSITKRANDDVHVLLDIWVESWMCMYEGLNSDNKS